ncbi:MAG: efflux transporter outer membrane subunit [Acetobacteraceae bacterium]|jgi:NodT family efflux transporter outer membrane factor (OMF) lipoprotein
MSYRSAMLAGAALIIASAAGCAVGPDFQPPQPPSVQGYTPEQLPASTASAADPLGGAQHFDTGKDIEGAWWQLLHSPPLDALVAQALKANPTLASAQAALRQARENVAAQRGQYFPTVTAGLSASRNLTPIAALSPASASGNPYYSLITPQLNVSFVPDVFGANRRTVESLEAQAANQQFQLEATYLTLTSNVVAAAVQEASLRGQIAANREIVKQETDLLVILRRQLDLGQVAGSDVAAQEAALAQAQQALPPLQKQLAQQRDLLTALAGRFPSQEIAEQFDLAGLQLPLDLPVSLPGKLIEQRPDVRAAEESMHSASALIGVAVAARLPQITLSGTIGNSASTAASMFTPGTNFWTIAGGVTTPIFDFGTLLHKQRAAQAAFDQAAAQYQSTVLTAFQNVADALRALQADADALNAAVASERAAARSLAIVRRQLDLGQVAYLALLNAQNTYQQTRVALVLAEANRLADTAALFQALGGGWWNRTDVATASTQVEPDRPR